MTRAHTTALATLLAALLLLSIWWFWQRVTAPPAPPVPATATAAPHTASPTITPTPVQAPPGYRLAGTALGDTEAFAIVESPSGRTGLYRLDAAVPGLGRLARIEAARIVIEGSSGQFEMQLAPAPAPTPEPTRSPEPAPLTPRQPLLDDDTFPE